MLIDVPLTGDRSYLHGADIFDALLALTGARRDIVLSLRAASDCAIEVCDAAGRPAADSCGAFRHRHDGTVCRHHLLRRADLPITARRDCDEEALIDGACFGADRATAPGGPHPGSFMRRAVAVYVALLEYELPDDYWSIAEIACAHPPRDDAALEVAVRNRVGNRFWNAAVLADDQPLGHVILARGQPRR